MDQHRFPMENHLGQNTFYFSTSVAYEDRIEAEKTVIQARCRKTWGRPMVYRPKMRQCKHNIRQKKTRAPPSRHFQYLSSQDYHCSCACTTRRCTQEGVSRTKDIFDRDIQTAVSTLPKHEIHIVLGDFNARLLERLPHEQDIIGMHIFREDTSCIDQLSEKQKDHRSRFTTFCQENGYVISWYQKSLPKHVTYRNVAALFFQGPCRTDRYAQLDYVLINRRWKNCTSKT